MILTFNKRNPYLKGDDLISVKNRLTIYFRKYSVNYPNRIGIKKTIFFFIKKIFITFIFIDWSEWHVAHSRYELLMDSEYA